MKQLDKTVFVIGASSGIGLEVCRIYLEKGYRLIAHYRTARAELDDLVASSDKAVAVQIDFADPASTTRARAEHGDLFKNVDVLINLAADMSLCTFEDARPEDMLHAITVNVLPGMLFMQELVPGMMARGGGRIVHASSIGVKFGGGQNSFVYSFSKHALEFIPAAFKAWAKRDVLVNVLRVGVTETEIHAKDPTKSLAERAKLIPMGRPATAEEMARSIYWFGSDENAYTTGQVIAISGGE